MYEGESFVTSLNLGLAIMMWMYSGWESMSTLAGEIENPQKVIPKALLIGTPLVIVTYFFTVLAAIRIARLDGVDNWMNMWTRRRRRRLRGRRQDGRRQRPSSTCC